MTAALTSVAEHRPDDWRGTRWAKDPHIRFGDPCYECAVPMTPASRRWSAFTIPRGMRKHAGGGLCSRCAPRHRKGIPVFGEVSA